MGEIGGHALREKLIHGTKGGRALCEKLGAYKVGGTAFLY